MSRNIKQYSVTVAVGMVLAGAPAVFAQPSITLYGGVFAVKDVDSRIDSDVLLGNASLFSYRLDDFDGGTVGGSWNVGIGEYFEAGVGLGFFQQTVPSVYLDYIDDDGFEIEQEFRVRVVPLTATVRVLPFGATPVQPYVGGGVGLYNWRYSEFGDFIDFNTLDVFPDRFVATGNTVGGVLLGGVRFPIGDAFTLGGEVQYHQATGEVFDDVAAGIVEDLDLGGLSTLVTFQIRF